MDMSTGRPESPSGRAKPVIRLMPDMGVFPLWSPRGALTPHGAQKMLGLDDALVAELLQWGQEGNSPSPPGGWRAWESRGAALHQKLVAIVGSDYEVEFIPE